MTTVATNPPGLAIAVDGTQFTAPKNFAQDYDASWTPASSHSVAVNSPLGSNIEDSQARLAFTGWSDSGAQTHNIAAGANATFTANFAVQFALTVSMPGLQDSGGSNCAGGTITPNPASPDTFYNAGTQVSLAVQPSAGWIFTGWQGDLAGNANPGVVAVTATKSVQAIFNTAADPLKVTGLAPAAGPLNGAAFALTVNGAGFTNATSYCFFDQASSSSKACGNTAFVSSNSVTLPVTPDLLAKVQTLSLNLSNSPDGQCSVSVQTSFRVQ